MTPPPVGTLSALTRNGRKVAGVTPSRTSTQCRESEDVHWRIPPPPVEFESQVCCSTPEDFAGWRDCRHEVRDPSAAASAPVSCREMLGLYRDLRE